MLEFLKGFNLSAWLAKLGPREYLLGILLLMILVGPALFGKVKSSTPTPQPLPEPTPLVKTPRPRKTRKLKLKKKRSL